MDIQKLIKAEMGLEIAERVPTESSLVSAELEIQPFTLKISFLIWSPHHPHKTYLLICLTGILLRIHTQRHAQANL